MAVVADRALTPELARDISERFGESEVAFVAPSLTGHLEQIAGIPDEGREEAQERVDRSVRVLADAGVTAEPAAVGDQDPVIAIEDLIRQFPDLEEVVLVNHAGDEQRWAEHDAFDRVRQRVRVPITLLEVDGEGSIIDRERSDPGKDAPTDAELRGHGGNMPPLTVMDFIAIIVAVVGTLVLLVIAGINIANSGDVGDQGDAGGISTGDIATALLAMAFFLINTWHVVGLTMAESMGYRGVGTKFFAYFSLIGTPIAIVLALLIS